jgi:hypothetical protein
VDINMPKVKCNSVKLKGFAQDSGKKYFSTHGEILFCRLCKVKVLAENRFTVQQHFRTTNHKNNLSRHSTKENRQCLLFEKASATLPSNKRQNFPRIFVK